jgi:hypothetical protein
VSAPDWGSVLAALRDGTAHAAQPDLLNRAVRLGHDIAPGTVGCSVTEVDGDGCRTPVASSPLALELDEAQYADSTGPCITAAGDRQPQQIGVMTAESRFPAFVAVAAQHGVRSSLSLPIAGRALPSALNVYSTQDSAFASAEVRRAADLLSRVIGAIGTAPDPSEHAGPDVAAARAAGDRVSAAIDLLVRRRDLDRAGAFAVLVAESCDRGVGVHAVAEKLLAGAGEEQL